jgi:hypothetical protein
MATVDIDRLLNAAVNPRGVPGVVALAADVTEDVPGRRGAGSIAWAGLYNTFTDPIVPKLLDDFETAVYRTTTENAPHG